MAIDPLYGVGLSPYTPEAYGQGYNADKDIERILGGLGAVERNMALRKVMDNPFIEAYIRRIAGAPELPKQPGFESPLYPEAGQGVEGLAPVVGIPQPMGAGRIPRNLAEEIVRQDAANVGGPVDGGNNGVSLTIGEPVITGRVSNDPLPYPDDPEYVDPKYQTTVTAKRYPKMPMPRAMPSLNPVHTPANMMPPLFSSPEEFEQFAKILPYGTQRDVTQMQTNASMENKKIETQQKNRGASLKASVDLLNQMNKRLMNQENLAARFKLARQKAATGDKTDLLKLAKEAADQAAEAERLLSNETIAALDTLDPESQGYRQYQLTKQQVAQKRQLSDYLYSLAASSYGAPVPRKMQAPAPTQVPYKAPADMSDEELNAEIRRLQSEG